MSDYDACAEDYHQMMILRLLEELINYLKKLRFREIFHFIEFSSGWQVGKLGNSPKLFCIFRQSLATCIWAEVVVFSNTKPSCRTQLEASVQFKGCSNSSPVSLSSFYLTLGATDFCALYAFWKVEGVAKLSDDGCTRTYQFRNRAFKRTRSSRCDWQLSCGTSRHSHDTSWKIILLSFISTPSYIAIILDIPCTEETFVKPYSFHLPCNGGLL